MTDSQDFDQRHFFKKHSVKVRYPECLITDLLLPHSPLIHFTEACSQLHPVQSQNTVSGQHGDISLPPGNSPPLVFSSPPEI